MSVAKTNRPEDKTTVLQTKLYQAGERSVESRVRENRTHGSGGGVRKHVVEKRWCAARLPHPSSGQQATTLREKWSIAITTHVGQTPQRQIRVRSADQTWLG